MIKVKDILHIADELNLYLVANKLKPASMIYIDPQLPKLEERIKIREEIKDQIQYRTWELDPLDLENFKEILGELNVSYQCWEQELTSERRSFPSRQKEIFTSKGQMFYVGSNSENLEKLVSAKGHQEIGFALGFPVEAVNSFQQIIDGERRDGQYLVVSLARTKKAGLKIPPWIAYLSYVPENLDFVNNRVSLTSKELGEKYRDFVKKTHPKLAERVEQDFFFRRMPVFWKPDGNGSYEVKYLL